MLLTVIGYKCHWRIMFLLECVMYDSKKSKGANWTFEQRFEHLFSIARRIGKVDDLVTDLDFQLPQIKQILWNLQVLKIFLSFLARKDAGKSSVENIYEMLFYSRKNYSPHTEERARIDDISKDDRFSVEEMFDYLKIFSKSVIEVENMTLKNKVLLGGWISTTAKVFRRD